MALYRAIRLQFGYGFESCDAHGPRRPKTKTLRNKGPFLFSPSLSVGAQKSVLKKRYRQGQFHAAIRVARKRCDSCVQGIQETDGIVKTFIPATAPPDPRRVSEGFLKGSLKGC